MRIHSLFGLISLIQLLAAQEVHWRQLSPTQFADCQMVYDLRRSRFVTHSNQTVEWDGGRWQPRLTAHTPPPRTGFGLTYDDLRERTVLFGGHDGNGPLDDVWEYDGFDWQDRSPAVRPSARNSMALAFDPLLGKTVMVAGVPFDPRTWAWDGNTWQDLGITGPTPRTPLPAMAFHWNTLELVLLGNPFSGTGTAAQTWTFNRTAWQQRQPTTVPPPRTRHSMCTDRSTGDVLMFGEGDPILWTWNGLNWSAGPSGPDPRWRPGMAADTAGTKLVVGGSLPQLLIGPIPMYIEDGLGDTWSVTASGWTQVDAGGPPTAAWRYLAFDAARNRMVCVTLPVLTTMGTSTMEWDGQRWHAIAAGPTYTLHSAMAHDATRGHTILFGGETMVGWLAFATNATHQEYDGVTWTIRTPATVPPARRSHAMCHDAARGVVVLFGGLANPSGGGFTLPLGDTWEWDGVTWTQRSSVGPAPRFDHGLAYDASRGQSVLFGGYDGAQQLADTWEWDGAGWSQRTPVQPPPPLDHLDLDYDAGSQRIRLFERASIVGPARQWAWDGSNWTEGSPEFPTQTYLISRSAGSSFLGLAGNTVWYASATAASAAARGTGCGSSAPPRLWAFGDPVLGSSTFALELAGALPRQPFLLGASIGSADTPLGGGCSLYLAGLDVLMLGSASTSYQRLALPLPLSPHLLGVEGTVQVGQVDPAAPLGIALTNGVDLRLGN